MWLSTQPAVGWIGLFAGRRRKKIGLDGAGHLDDQRLASAVKRLARRRPDPLLAHTIFLDVAPLDAAKAHADTARQRRLRHNKDLRGRR